MSNVRTKSARACGVASVFGCLLLGACGSVPLETATPPGFDMNGEWQLIAEDSDPAPKTAALRSRGVSLAFAAQDFPVLTAVLLSIEQGKNSMGVRYDGKDYRDISWGKRQRGLWQVRAGWRDDALMIISEASDADAVESFRLQGDRLVVELTIEAGSERMTSRRTYRRR